MTQRPDASWDEEATKLGLLDLKTGLTGKQQCQRNLTENSAAPCVASCGR